MLMTTITINYFTTGIGKQTFSLFIWILLHCTNESMLQQDLFYI